MDSPYHRIAELARTLCLVRGVDIVPRGHVRVETELQYPDGSSIDVFVYNDPDQPLLPPTLLTDLAQTTDFLINAGVKPWATKKRQRQLEEAVGLYGAHIRGGSIEMPLGRSSELKGQILRMAQACLHASGLALTKRLALQSEFADEVEATLIEAELEFETGATLEGNLGPITVDFLVKAPHTQSAVFSLSSRTAGSAHTATNEVLRKTYDLRKAERPEQLITIVDDSVPLYEVFKKEDLVRLEDFSTVFTFSERARALEMMGAHA